MRPECTCVYELKHTSCSWSDSKAVALIERTVPFLPLTDDEMRLVCEQATSGCSNLWFRLLLTRSVN